MSARSTVASPSAGWERWRPLSRTLARLRLWLGIVMVSTMIGMAYWSILGAVYGIDDHAAVLLHGGEYGTVIGGSLGLF